MSTALRVAETLAPRFPGWRLQPEVVQNLDDYFDAGDQTELWRTATEQATRNPLLAAVAQALYDELVAQEKQGLEYKMPWWRVG